MFDKNLMVEFSADGRLYRDLHWLVGGCVGVGVGWVGVVGVGDGVQEAATILAQDLGSCRERGMREDVWQLQDRVEQRGAFFNSASRPCCNHQSWGGIGEEGLGFWALKSERG